MTRWTDELEASVDFSQWAPDRPWQAAQRERDLLFMHYEVDADEVRALVPPALDLQLCGGSAWIGLIALQVDEVQLRNFRPPSAWSRFSELDLITYVSHQDRRGIYFLSIESAHRWLSMAVRWTTGLPYLFSGLKIGADDGGRRVTCGPRSCQGAATAALDFSYSPQPHEKPVDPGSPIGLLLDQFSSFVIDWRGRVRELDEVHSMWRPMEADVDVRTNTLGQAVGVDLPLQPTLVHYATSRHILTWWPQLIRPGRPGLAPTAPRT